MAGKEGELGAGQNLSSTPLSGQSITCVTHTSGTSKGLRERDGVGLRLGRSLGDEKSGREGPARVRDQERVPYGRRAWIKDLRTQNNLPCAVLGWMVRHPLDVLPSASSLL